MSALDSKRTLSELCLDPPCGKPGKHQIPYAKWVLSEVAGGYVSPLSEQDMLDLATHFASLKVDEIRDRVL
jgi:hypothetical protein